MRLDVDRPLDPARIAVARLADGSLRPAARRRAQALVDARPELARDLERQRSVMRVLHAGGPAARPALARTVTQPALAPKQPLSRMPARRLATAAAAAAIAVGGVVVVGDHLPSRSGGGASIQAMARLASSPATVTGGPREEASHSDLLQFRFADITYPSYRRALGWSAAGSRADRLGGRLARTVFYRSRDGERMSYTVIDGAPLRRPTDARRIVVQGVTLYYLQDAGLKVVTLERHGRTCVLAGRLRDRTELLELAAWPVAHTEA